MADEKAVKADHGDPVTATVLVGDAQKRLREVPEGTVQCAVTSPPYFGLRDYGVEGQIGVEAVPDCLGWATKAPCGACYVCRMVEVFREVRRVLREDGVVFLNLGDSYASQGGSRANSTNTLTGQGARREAELDASRKVPPGAKPKDLIGIPWRVALALQADGWYLRQDIIWAKGNPMPESVRDRCTKSHEHVFLLAKSDRYWWDVGAAKEPAAGEGYPHRNRRDVWVINAKPYKDAHFAVMPEALADLCVRLGSRPGDTVLDPFAGAGTTAVCALAAGRSFVGCELKSAYALLMSERVEKAGGVLAVDGGVFTEADHAQA